MRAKKLVKERVQEKIADLRQTKSRGTSQHKGALEGKSMGVTKTQKKQSKKKGEDKGLSASPRRESRNKRND